MKLGVRRGTIGALSAACSCPNIVSAVAVHDTTSGAMSSNVCVCTPTPPQMAFGQHQGSVHSYATCTALFCCSVSRVYVAMRFQRHLHMRNVLYWSAWAARTLPLPWYGILVMQLCGCDTPNALMMRRAARRSATSAATTLCQAGRWRASLTCVASSAACCGTLGSLGRVLMASTRPTSTQVGCNDCSDHLHCSYSISQIKCHLSSTACCGTLGSLGRVPEGNDKVGL